MSMKTKSLVTILAFFLLACLTACGGGPSGQAAAGGAAPTPPVAPSAPAVGDAEYEALIQQMYIVYFGRPADPAELAQRMQSFRAAGVPKSIDALSQSYVSDASVRNLVDNNFDTPESAQFYAAGSNLARGLVFVAYDTAFSHVPSAADADHWNVLVKDGATRRSGILLGILAGAKGGDADLLARKVRAATLFTRVLDSAGQSAIYNGPIARMIAGAMIHNTPSTPDDAALQSGVDVTVRRLSALAGGSVVDVPPGTRNVLLLASAEQMAGNGARVTALAGAIAADLNGLRPGGPAWTVRVQTAAGSVAAVRDQLRSYHSAMLIGRVPVATRQGVPALDFYRLPDCALMQADATGEVNTAAGVGIDPHCKNGLVIAVLRAASAASEISDVARKLDQMIAYHKASSAANASWIRRLFYVQAGWFGGTDAHLIDPLGAWAGLTMYAQNVISYPDEGTATQRRDAFVDCITHGNEICGADLHGAPELLQFEGPGSAGVFYSSDSVDWRPADLAAGAVQAKYITLDSCGTQNFLSDQSVGAALLMNGSALLTRGNVETTWISNAKEQDVVRSEYAMLQNGSTFAETVFGRMENTPDSLQGDPFITMRPVPGGLQPRLVVDGMHFNGGANAYTINLPDSLNGSRLIHVITYTNRGDADLHLRLSVTPVNIGVDAGDSRGYQRLGSDGSVFYTDFVQTFSNGTVLSYPAIEVETYGGAMHATLKPGQSVAVTYRMNVDSGSTPVSAGQYSWDLVNTSDDPSSARVVITMKARVR